jgi:hypothetical protein
MSRRSFVIVSLCLAAAINGYHLGSETRTTAKSNEQRTKTDTSQQTAREIITELRLRAAQARAETQAPDESLRSDSVPLSQDSSKTLPKEPSAPLNPNFAGISSEELYGQLIQIQAHWLDSAGRQEWFEVDVGAKQDSRKVLSLIHADHMSDVIDHGHSVHLLEAKTFSTFRYEDHDAQYPLCDGEPYQYQPMGAFCSGVLVGSRIVATAEHCIASDDAARKTRFVFDFRMNDEKNAKLTFSDDEVFTGKRIIQKHASYTEDDWELIELDRDVKEPDRIAEIRRTGVLDPARKVYALGHPNGLPLKVSVGGNVRNNDSSKIFVVGLDVYAASSGCPVFNDKHVVEGILARGDTDFIPVGKCVRTNNCPGTGCPGDDITRTTSFAGFVPK